MDKFKINEKYLKEIYKERKARGYTAKQLSVLCGKSPFWIANLENRKIKNITCDDAIMLIQKLFDMSYDDAEDFFYQISITSNDSTKDHPVLLEERVEKIYNELKKIIKSIDYSNPRSVYREGSPIYTLEALLDTDAGRIIFTELLQYPLHKMSEDELFAIINILHNNIKYEYFLSGLESPIIQLGLRKEVYSSSNYQTQTDSKGIEGRLKCKQTSGE